MAIRRSPLRRSLLRRSAALAAATTAALVLTACGGDSTPPSRSAHSGQDTTASAAPSAGRTGHNAQDVTFAQQMIPHHRQAVAMAGLAPTRARSQQVKDLAARIRKAQDPEIATMTGWLKAWGASVPEADASGTADMPGMDHPGHSGSGHSAASMSATPAMPGMMSDAEMSGLEKMSGDVFDRAFLRMMIGHHEGALDMARTEQAKGAYGPATALAKSIVASQSAEIAGMRKMLGER
ncbi:DUF305 domain-containing protein [Streptomyces sp. NPDC007070]|uniref:DUF305 domain-containing protein n=1 Tax=Streptomyces sp. NPDC007070 TaxID=3154312 RepID=UPI0033C2EDED